MPPSFRVGRCDWLAHHAARHLFRKAARLRAGQSLISFTFDDFPKSALTCAGRILSDHGMAGTYYASFKLAGNTDQSGRYFDEQDVHDLLRAGHELGCHTFSHNNFMMHRPGRIRREFELNAEACRRVTQGVELVSFAYPYGRVSPSLKRIAGQRFASARSTRPGLNVGAIDLNDLRALALVPEIRRSDIEEAVRRNENLGGWLIFFTHDVSDSPSRYGCGTAEFEAAARLAAGSRSRVVTVRDALGFLSPPDPDPAP
jgi:peptidoglycan/xylan/chitin deacetylase (PgdA/CDA1 family)